MIRLLCQGAAVLLLAIYAVMDIRERKVWCPLAMIIGVIGTVVHIWAGDRALLSNVYALLPGILLAILALASGQAIGYGDCLAIGACGALTGLRHVCVMTMVAFVLAGAWAVILLIRKEADKDTKFAFMPFLFTAQLILFLI